MPKKKNITTTYDKKLPAKTSPAVDTTSPSQSAAKLVGSDDIKFSAKMIQQVIGSIFAGKSGKIDILTVMSMFEQLKPRDAMEGVLVTQMIATHETAMECLRRAAIPDQPLQGYDAALRHGARLMQLYLDQMKTLNKYRGQGDQKMVIEHVNIAPGGQAIVGNVTATPALAKPQQQALTHDTQSIRMGELAPAERQKEKNAARKK